MGVPPRRTKKRAPFQPPGARETTCRGGQTAIFLADLIPTAAHLPLPWIMGYDLEPLRTLESKRSVIEEALARGWTLVFEHDPTVATGRLERTNKGVELRDLVRAPPQEQQAANTRE